jgi:hypothetical protein
LVLLAVLWYGESVSLPVYHAPAWMASMTPPTDADRDRIVAAVCIVRELPPAQLGAICAALRDNGAGALADVLIGTIPFETMPAGEMDRLTDA